MKDNTGLGDKTAIAPGSTVTSVTNIIQMDFDVPILSKSIYHACALATIVNRGI